MKTIATAVLALGLALTPGFSQGTPEARPRPRPEEFKQKMTDRFFKELALTPDQKTKADAIMAAHKGPMETKRGAAEGARKAFMEALKKPDTKVEDLKALHRASADANLDLLLEHRSQRQEIRALLTPEQREKAARLEGRMEGRMKGHRGGFPEGGMR